MSMITIDSEWHAYFSIYAQFGSNLSIYLYLYWCCRANLCKKSSALLLFHIYLMDVPIHVHNGARFFRCVCTCDSIIGYFFHHHTHSNMFHSFFLVHKMWRAFFSAAQACLKCFIRKRPIKLSYHYINWSH